MASLFLRNHVMFFATIALPSLLAAGCGPRQPPPPVDRSQDERIRGEVAARIGEEPSLDTGSIRVVVEGAMVMLHGSVQGIGAWQCAIANAELVPGVRSVVDYLVIERGERDVRCLAPRPDSRLIVSDPS